MYFLSTNRFREGVAPEAIGKVIPDHIEWTRRLIGEGTILQVGKWGETGGMVIFKADDEQQAEEILQGDPLVASGIVSSETARLYPDVPLD